MYRLICLSLCLLICSCKATFKPSWMAEQAPDKFKARFETTKGDFEIEFIRSWSPKAVDRVYQQINHKFYNNITLYRVVPNFVVQFGHMDSTKTAKTWDNFHVEDEVVMQSNLKGTISYARAGKNSRKNHLFINLKDNKRLDTVTYNGVKGFPPFGKVTKGLEVVEGMFSGYGNETMKVYDSLAVHKKEFRKRFPKLDVIKKTYIIKD